MLKSVTEIKVFSVLYDNKNIDISKGEFNEYFI